MTSRGEITIFVVLGLVILVIIGIILLITSSSLRKEMPFKLLSIEEEVSDVREYVTSCLDESLKNAVAQCSGTNPLTGEPKCPDYETELAGKVVNNFCNCIPRCNTFPFEHIQIEVKGGIDIEANLVKGEDGNEKEVIVTMEYPLQVKKGDTEYLLGTTEPFVAEYPLKQSGCLPIPVNENCEATETKTVNILNWEFTFHEGERVAISEAGACIACP